MDNEVRKACERHDQGLSTSRAVRAVRNEKAVALRSGGELPFEASERRTRTFRSTVSSGPATFRYVSVFAIERPQESLNHPAQIQTSITPALLPLEGNL